MAIEIRSTSSASDPSLSSEGTFTNPLSLTFNGSMGGEQIQTLWLKNNSGSSTNVEVEITGATNPASYEFFLRKTSADDWTSDSINFANIAANATVTFDMRVNVDPNTEVDNFTNLKIKVTET